MVRWVVTTFLACIVTGCVTVTEQDMGGRNSDIDAADARIELGLGYLADGNRLKARENLELAVKYAPNYYRTLNSIAYYYQLVGENTLAEQTYIKALRESPKNSEVLNNYGAFLCRLGQYEKADEFFTRAIKQPSNYQVVDSLENAAICSLKSGNRAKAEHYFTRSLDYDPHRYFSLLQLSKLKSENGDYNDARVRLIKFHDRFGYQLSSLHLLIELENKAGNKELAGEYAKILKVKYPSSTKN
ncbi:type IV pilus biogenesis/stability protein PilW [Vibrio sp. VB16]|uniref:type IV pilus biogenesis/stability protein PilW n=1 Tax=Vibrio sp. VB16 TaxID=2785746 RepID=UPI00189E39D8|nr:type IV pilus biogenesis/stability protein PilW [Vibrio sp. VB16]UGA55366.1 type IV pilus biogenesis/stability protein PilW [Vibrio sp. VB16]